MILPKSNFLSPHAVRFSNPKCALHGSGSRGMNYNYMARRKGTLLVRHLMDGDCSRLF
jgi:hypothetical protein